VTRALTIAVLIAFATPAAAAPPISIHARTELRLEPIRKDYAGAHVVAGSLVDRFSGVGLGVQTVTLVIGGREYTATTDNDGRFEITVPATTGKQDVQVRFSGDSQRDPASVELVGVDVNKAAVELELETTSETSGAKLTITATAGTDPLDVKVKVFAGAADAPPEKLALVGETTTGGAAFLVTRAAAGGPGKRRVRVVFEGDAVYNGATADANIELTTATTVRIILRSSTVAFEDDVLAVGTVVDEDGRGVTRASVALIVDGKQLAHTSTSANGEYRFAIEGTTLGVGDHALQTEVQPTEGWLRGDESDIVHVSIEEPQPVPLAYTIAAFAFTALVAAGFFAARSKPWQKLKRKEPVGGERAPEQASEDGAPGLALARPSLVSTLRRPADHGFAGVVRDAVRHRPLPEAVVVLRRGDQSLDALAGAEGRFEFENLAAGEWRAEVTMRGHVTERFPLTVPHRGELRGARVDLVPVRERIFSLYKRAALPHLPDPALWGVWSPRQVFDHVRKRKLSAALARLTDFVEAAYFAARLPDEDVIPEATHLVEAALQEHLR